MRTFIALDVPVRLRGRIEEIQDGVRGRCRGARWVGQGGFHVTLKFLGETRLESVEPVCSALKGLCGGTAPFAVSLEGLGVFPSVRRPRVLWMGVGVGEDKVCSLQSGVEARMEAFGFSREKRAFSPHLTLARFRDGGGIEEGALATDFEAVKFEASEVVFFQSILRPEGAQYVPLGKFPLGG
ncbi:MAG: RNA 2',3'-cyclic phosphodiesterase [bacterium]